MCVGAMAGCGEGAASPLWCVFMLQQIFTIIAPVLAIALVGYVWERRRLPFDTNMVSYIVSYIGSPCLLLHTLMVNPVDLAVMSRIVASATLVSFTMGLVGLAIVRVLKLPHKVYVPALMFPNSGNMGMPLCLFAFGNTGLAMAVGYFATMSALQFSVGESIASGKASLRHLLTPSIMAIVVAGFLIGFNIKLPAWIDNTIGVLGDVMIPLMLMSLGTSLAQLQVTGLRRSLSFSLLRLGGGFVIAVGISWVMGLDGAARGAVIIQSTMPVAVFNYLFALRYGNRPEEVAAMVFLSTIISFISLPFLMAFVLSL
jgi:predicted permease